MDKNFEKDTRILFLEKALRERNQEIAELQDKLRQADSDYNRLKAKQSSLIKRLKILENYQH